eukprot:1389323-Pleurochrysis_carterae.AAC.1
MQHAARSKRAVSAQACAQSAQSLERACEMCTVGKACNMQCNQSAKCRRERRSKRPESRKSMRDVHRRQSMQRAARSKRVVSARACAQSAQSLKRAFEVCTVGETCNVQRAQSAQCRRERAIKAARVSKE